MREETLIERRLFNMAYALNDFNKISKNYNNTYAMQLSDLRYNEDSIDNYRLCQNIFVRFEGSVELYFFEFQFYKGIKIFLRNDINARCRDLRFLNLDVPNEFKKIIIDNLDLINFND